MAASANSSAATVGPVPGDAKALAVLDLDQNGWADFLVTRNNGSTFAFRNLGASGRHPLRISLRGPAGNPTAIGAQVTLQLKDGSTQTGEIQAGSGYFSQSTAACFFGYPANNPPLKVRVRWPSGAVTEQAMKAGATNVALSFDGS